MLALIATGCACFWMIVAGLLFDDRLMLPGLLGLVVCWGLVVWVSWRRCAEAVAEFRLEQVSRDLRWDWNDGSVIYETTERQHRE